MPRVPVGRIWLTAVLVNLGRDEEASRAAQEILQLAPGFTIDCWPAFKLYRDPTETELIIKSLRKAGLP